MRLTVLRHLDLEAPLLPGLPSHISAASGMARTGEWLHVVPDDGVVVSTFRLGSNEPGRVHPLFTDTVLSPDEVERKKAKPDLESMTVVPWSSGQALLTLGSGSTPGRCRGVLQPLYDCGEVDGAALVFDLTPLYAGLPYRERNIEGVAVVGGRLFLGQRGNSAEGRNELVELDLAAALACLAEGRAWGPNLLKECKPVGLGTVMGVRLTLTDLTAYGPHHLLISAAAEDTDNPYDDGAILGSVLGRYSLLDGTLSMVSLDGPWKVEGVEALDDGRILMVTDGDDPLHPAALLQATDVHF